MIDCVEEPCIDMSKRVDHERNLAFFRRVEAPVDLLRIRCDSEITRYKTPV